MRIYFVRHCEPDYTNHNDMERPLTDKGRADAEQIAGFFADKNVDVVMSSPYKRAVDTVKGIAESIGTEVITDDDFRERRVSDGSWVDDIGDFAARQWKDFSYRMKHGESLGEVQKRNVDALNRAIERFSGKTMVIGSHATALSTILNHYDSCFDYGNFLAIVNQTPWVVEMEFDGKQLVFINENVDISLTN